MDGSSEKRNNPSAMGARQWFPSQRTSTDRIPRFVAKRVAYVEKENKRRRSQLQESNTYFKDFTR